MDVTSALRSNIAPLQEYLLQGSILEAHRDSLLHRLNGLCDNVDTGPEKFHDHEIVYSLKGSPAVQAVILRVRHALDHPEDPWHVRYLGQADFGDKSRHTLVRSCIDVSTSENIGLFLNEMGFALDYEYVVKGYMFRKGRLKVTVSKIMKVNTPNNPESAEPFTMSYLVELSVIAPHGQDQIQEDMKNFAEQLKPCGHSKMISGLYQRAQISELIQLLSALSAFRVTLVHLEKVDHRRLQQASS